MKKLIKKLLREGLLDEETINELVVHKVDKESDLDGKHFILYKGNVWVFDDEEYEEYWEQINEKLPFEITGDFHDDSQMILEEYAYVLVGDFEDGSIVLNGTMNLRHSSSSTDLQKLSKQLDIPVRSTHRKGAYGDDQGEFKVRGLAIKKIQDKTFYHGTCMKYLNSIQSQGIRPTDTSNFKVTHDDKIFITLNLEKALFHAETAAMKNNSYPVIISHKLPDPSKLVLDYDVAIDFLGKDHPEVSDLGYDNVLANTGAYDVGSNEDKTFGEKINLSMKLGVFGYTGRIPSSHIQDVHIDLYTLNRFWELFDEEFGYNEEPINHESPIWSEMEDVDEWSELSIGDTLKRIGQIEEEFQDQYREEEEDEDDDWN